MRSRQVVVLVLGLLSAASVLGAETVIQKVRRTRTLVCGIDQSEAEYSTTDDHGPRVEFDRDLCKAVAIAVAGPQAQIKVKGYPDDETSTAALLSREIDLIPSLSDDLSHSTIPGISLTRPVFFDGVSVMVAGNAGIHSTADLSGKKICFISETETEVMLRAWFEVRHLNFLPFPFQEQGEMEAAYATGNCPGLAADQTRLAETRASFAGRAGNYVILPEIISKDPMAMAYRSADAEWGRALEWTMNVLVLAEENGLAAGSITGPDALHNPTAERLMGKTHELGHPLGLDEDWAETVIRLVGNYGEIFARDLGPGTALNLNRGQNELGTKGGLLYGIPPK